MLAIHGSGGANAGLLGESDGLSLVLHILVAEISVSPWKSVLKYDNRRSFQLGGIEGEEYVHGAIGFGRDERGLSSHLLVVHLERFACGFVHEHTL